MRTTKKELTAVFQLWLTANNFTEGFYYKGSPDAFKPTNRVAEGYVLDYAACYGGYRIEYLEESTGHRTPFGDARYSARELVAMLRFQMNCLTEKGTNS